MKKLRKPYTFEHYKAGILQEDKNFKTMEEAIEHGEYCMLKELGYYLHPKDYADFKHDNEFSYKDHEFKITIRK